MSYLVWEIDHDAIRTACIDSALFHCGWDAFETLETLIEVVHREDRNGDLSYFFGDFIEVFTACRVGKLLIKHANDQLSAIYQNAPPLHEKGKWISGEEIITSKFDTGPCFIFADD